MTDVMDMCGPVGGLLFLQRHVSAFPRLGVKLQLGGGRAARWRRRRATDRSRMRPLKPLGPVQGWCFGGLRGLIVDHVDVSDALC
jgi:hypothetical protein